MLLLIEKMMWHEFDAPGFKKIVGFSPQQSLSYKLTLIKKNKKRQKKFHEIVVEVEMKLKINLSSMNICPSDALIQSKDSLV